MQLLQPNRMKTSWVVAVALVVVAIMVPSPAMAGDRRGTGHIPVQPLDRGLDVAGLQARLSELGYPVGQIDGRYGPKTWQGACAARWLGGRPLSGPVAQADIDHAVAAASVAARRPQANYIDVSLACQALVMVQNGQVVLVTPVSTGNGKEYVSRGKRAIARTPRGEFSIVRKIEGLRKSELGVLYNPVYFFRGYALHGSSDVPARPASHGCIRVPMEYSMTIFSAVPDTRIYVG